MDLQPGTKYELKEMRQLNLGGELVAEPFWYPVTFMNYDEAGNKVVKLPRGEYLVLHRGQELRPL